MSNFLFAQIRNYVGVVRQQYYPSHKEYLEELRDSLKDRGYKTYASYIDDYLKGGFGSGFIYVASDGTNYVITNRHVVSQAASASIEFENPETGVITKYENLSVLYTDDDIDISILQFEGNAKPFKKGLALSSAKLKDGDEVYSAGFPGLGGEPVWQFGKGNITNAYARIKDLIDPSISTIIQHSAQVDAGNSGGPLMIASKTGTAGYELVGINTWKAAGRDSTNFALPAKLVEKLIEDSKVTVSDSDAKAKRLQKLKEVLTDSSMDYTSVVKFISYEYASKNGQDELENILSYGSSSVVNRIAGEFAYNPLEGLRYAVAYRFYEDFSKENATDENLESLNWVKEHGIFRLDFSDGKKSAKKNSKSTAKTKSETKTKSKAKTKTSVSFIGIEGEDFISANAGILIPFADNDDVIKNSICFTSNFNIYFGSRKMWGAGVNYETRKFNGDNYNLFGIDGIFRVPLNFDLFCISPKVTGGFGLGFGAGGNSVVHAYVEAGIETFFNLGIDYFRPGFEICYKGSAYTIKDDYNSVETKNGNILFRIIIGFKFD